MGKQKTREGENVLLRFSVFFFFTAHLMVVIVMKAMVTRVDSFGCSPTRGAQEGKQQQQKKNNGQASPVAAEITPVFFSSLAFSFPAFFYLCL